MKTEIRNITICVGAVGDTIPFIEDSLLQIVDNRISYAGPLAGAPAFRADKIIDGDGALAMPGMVNLHTHNPMTLLRSVGGNLNLEDWLHKAIFPRERKLSDEAVYLGSMLGIMEMLRYGTTNFCDMYMFMDTQAKAVSEVKMRATLGHGAVSFKEEDTKDYDKGIDFAIRWNNKENGRIKTAIAPHSTYLVTDTLLRNTRKHAAELQLPIHIHISETQTEVQTVIDKFGARPPQVLEKYGLLEFPIIAAHCVWLTEEDMDLVKNYNFTVAHNPISNLKLASGVAPVIQFLEKGINVGIGTDGVASNNNLNLWEEMRAMPLLQKGVSLDPTVISPAQTLYAATIAGAKALGYEDLGLLKEGYLADIVLVDLNTPTAYPCNSLAEDIIYALQGSDVQMTMVDGNVLYHKGEYTGIDKNAIFKAVKAAAKSLE